MPNEDVDNIVLRFSALEWERVELLGFDVPESGRTVIAARLKKRHKRPPLPNGRAFTDTEGLILALRILHTEATLATLAREHRVGATTVQKHVARWCTADELRATGIEKMKRTKRLRPVAPAPRPSKFRFSGVDWTRTDAAISRVVGCTRQTVANVRRSLGKPRADWHHRPERVVRLFGLKRETRDAREAEMVNRWLTEADVTCASLAEKYGCASGTIYNVIARHTTTEQRRGVRSWKIATSKRESPAANVIAARAKSVRRDAGMIPAVSTVAKPSARTARERINEFLRGLEAVA